MKYTFVEELLTQGNRYYVEIPFNVWEECQQKGLVPVKVYIQDFEFECKLVPKGEGLYYIPIAKKIASQIKNQPINISFEVIDGLTRINHDSPYSFNNPIRKIDSIQNMTYPKAGYCGQLCIAMLTMQSVDEIVELMQAKAWQCSFAKLIETLDYFGIGHDEKVTYTKGQQVELPTCCIVNVKRETKSHFSLYYKGKYYDTTKFDMKDIIGYLKIIVE